MTAQLVAPNVRYFDSWQESNAEWAGGVQHGTPTWVADRLGLDLTVRGDFAAFAGALAGAAAALLRPPARP